MFFFEHVCLKLFPDVLDAFVDCFDGLIEALDGFLTFKRYCYGSGHDLNRKNVFLFSLLNGN